MPVPYGSESDVAEGSVFDGGSGDYREEFLYAVEVARARHDPATDWEGFRDTLWEYLARVFGVDVADPDTAGGAPPGEGLMVTHRRGRPSV